MKQMFPQDKKYLKIAIKKSRDSVAKGGYPVGALIVQNDKIISYGLSNGKSMRDATMHAEIDAIRKAEKILKKRDLKDATLYSSMEPCLMCFSASFWAHIPRVVYACGRKKLPKIHFEGKHNLRAINKQCRRPLELIHVKGLEDEALEIIQGWEEKIKALSH